VVGGALQRHPRLDQAAQRVGERGPGRITDRRVEEAGRPRRGWVAAARLPGVEADVVVVAAGRDERGFGAEALDQLEAEDAAVEVERPLEVGDFQVDVADVDAGIDRARGGGLAGGAVPVGLGGARVRHCRGLGSPARRRRRYGRA
jgi:hypothetical protein